MRNKKLNDGKINFYNAALIMIQKCYIKLSILATNKKCVHVPNFTFTI